MSNDHLRRRISRCYLLHVVASSQVALTASSEVSESVKGFRAAIDDPCAHVVLRDINAERPHRSRPTCATPAARDQLPG